MMKIWMIVTLVASFAAGQQCLAIALEGGGGRGAYEAGAFLALSNATRNINVQYNVATGISIGAVNAGILSNYAMGQEEAAAQDLLAFWRSLNGSQSIFIEWPGGYIDGLLFKQGLFDNSPAVSLAKNWIIGPRNRNITVGSTNLDLGILQTFNESVGLAIRDGIIASGSLPFFFPPHEFEGYSWADGGCIDNLDVFSAIERCLDVTGNNEKAVTVDMFFCHHTGPLSNETTFKTPKVFERIFEIRSMDSSIWYSYNAQRAYPNVNFRYSITPSVQTPGLLNFTQAAVEFDLALAKNDVNNMLSAVEVHDGRAKIRELYERSKFTIFP